LKLEKTRAEIIGKDQCL